MTDIAIRATHLSKCYHIYNNPQDRLKQFVAPRLQRMVGRTPKQYFHEFWAVNDVSFDIKKGETVGIIGRNGSGKSTLLQLLCGTLTPTHGQVEINGRVAALLELGSGFNPEFTGRENVYMNASILGLSNEEVLERFDDIAAFADIGEFIEQPVKTYSSGMFVRLAFAVNILSNPDIMIVDEALAVGDMNFQAKCMTALTRIQERGATVLFVSHDVSALKSLCSRGIYLDHGQLKKIGPAADVADHYMRIMREEMNKLAPSSETVIDVSQNPPIRLASDSEIEFKTSVEFVNRTAQFRYGTGEAKISFVELLSMNDEPINSVEFNQKVKARVFFEAYAEKSISVNLNILDDKKINIMGCNFFHVDQPLLAIKPTEKYWVEYVFPLPLQEGNYSLEVQLTTPLILNQTAEFLDVIKDAVVFQVHRWEKARVWSKALLFAELKLKRMNSDV